MTRWQQHPATDPGLWRFAVLTLLAGLLFVAAVMGGERVMCAAYQDRPAPPPYCEVQR